MALLNTAKTRLGLGGSSQNYARPFAAKAEAVVDDVIVTSSGSWNKDWATDYGPDSRKIQPKVKKAKKAKNPKRKPDIIPEPVIASEPVTAPAGAAIADSRVIELSEVRAKRAAKKRRRNRAMAIILLKM